MEGKSRKRDRFLLDLTQYFLDLAQYGSRLLRLKMRDGYGVCHDTHPPISVEGPQELLGYRKHATKDIQSITDSHRPRSLYFSTKSV